MLAAAGAGDSLYRSRDHLMLATAGAGGCHSSPGHLMPFTAGDGDDGLHRSRDVRDPSY